MGFGTEVLCKTDHVGRGMNGVGVEDGRYMGVTVTWSPELWESGKTSVGMRGARWMGGMDELSGCSVCISYGYMHTEDVYGKREGRGY